MSTGACTKGWPHFRSCGHFSAFLPLFLLLRRVFSSALSRKTVEWRPSAFPSTTDFWQSVVSMVLRSNNRQKDGKDHRYFSIVENHRISSGKTVQRTVLYLGEINDQQQAAWRKSLSVFDEQQQEYANLSLFPDDREIPADAVDSLQVKLSGLELRRPRLFGSCWLGCQLWQQLGLDEFWDTRLAGSREEVAWEKVLQLLVVNRLLDPGSEFRVHRKWYLSTAMDALLGTDFAVAEKDRLYRCLDRVLEHKQELFLWLRQKWADLFQADFEVLLYDLTSTYFEGAMEQNPKAKYGHSRDQRTDCLQVVIALVITPDGFPLAYEVMNGNTSDRATLRGFLDKIEKTYGKAKRMWVMDRGIPSEAILQEMRDPAREIFYLVGTPKGKIQEHEKKWLDLPWQKVRESVEVKLFEQEGELYVLAKSEGRQAKETAMRRKRLARLLKKLRAMRRSLPSLVQLLMRLGAAKSAAGRAFQFVHLHRTDAHILIAFLAYCLQITLKQRLLLHAPGLTPTAVLEKLAEIQMIDIWIPTVDQRWLILPRYTQPSPDTKLLIEKLKLHLPSQPPPRLVAQKESSEIEVQTVR